MYQSKKYLEKSSLPALKSRLNEFLEKVFHVRCKGLKNRKIFLNKLPHAIVERKNAKNRLICFWVAIDILRESTEVDIRIRDGKNEYAICGLSAEGKKVFIHLREEKIQKDKKLFLLSTYCQS